MKTSYKGGAQMGSVSGMKFNSVSLNGERHGAMQAPQAKASANPGGYMPARASHAEGKVPLPGQPSGGSAKGV